MNIEWEEKRRDFMKLFNSLHNKIEELKPIQKNEISMYVCGPTVYNHAHIGNARPMIVFDTLRKILQAIGYKVKFVSNYTDVDDKIIQRAKEESVSENEISARYIQAYEKIREQLQVENPSACPKVTETMSEIIAFIEQLIHEGYAYEVDGDVYFRVGKLEGYGQLSNQQKEELLVGARIHENEKKENPLDFTLWKKTKEGIRWESSFSDGRPGWHTECVVMIQKEFQRPLIDIHGGGMDLKFPHHENEIAQSQAIYHTSIANIWMHNGMVNINGEKMSKSLGNVIWAKDMIETLGADVMRWIMLSTHYRSPLNINDETIQMAQKECSKVLQAQKQARLKLQLANNVNKDIDQESYSSFMEAMCDDLNTPNAFKVVFELTKRINQTLRQKELHYEKLANDTNALEAMLRMLGIVYYNKEMNEDVRNLFKQWEKYKLEKQFQKADQYRSLLQERGYI